MVDSPTKILIIRFSSIGDILLTSPLVRQVRKHFPNARIDYLIKDQFSELMRFNPHINHLYALKVSDHSQRKKLKEQLKQNGYHLVFDLHNNIRSNYFRRGMGAVSVRTINKDKIAQLLLVLFKINRYRSIKPIPDRYLKVAEGFHVKDDHQGLELFWPAEQEAAAEKMITEAKLPPEAPFVCFAPGAAHFTKRWPVENFLMLSRRIIHQGLKIVILGGELDIKWGRMLERRGEIFDFTGKLSLLETAAILARARAVVTNDSGLMHMACAVKRPVTAIFGSTVREFGFFPYRCDSIVLENKTLSCRPCTHIGRKKCPKRHFKCMTEIKSDDVFKVLLPSISQEKKYK